MFVVLRIRDYRLVLTGQLLSSTGNWLLLVAGPYFVFHLTSSTIATGLSLMAQTVPAVLLGTVAGVFADRWNRRHTMIATDVLRAATVLSMLAVHTRGAVWIIYAALTVESAFSQFFEPARRALVPSLVGRGPELSAANALSQLIGGVIRLIVGPLGGVLYVFFGFPCVVAIDAGSYLASALLIVSIRFRPPAARPPPSAARGAPVRHFTHELRTGIRHVWRTPGLRSLFGVALLFFTGNAMLTALLVPYLGAVLHAGAQSLGILFGALGFGYIFGAPLSRLVAGRISNRATTTAALAMLAAVFAVSFNVPHFGWDVALFTLIGPPAVCFLVTADTSITRRTPDRRQGRVGSAYLALQGTATLAGMAAGSVLGQRIGIVTTMDLAAALIAVSAASGLLTPASDGSPADGRGLDERPDIAGAGSQGVAAGGRASGVG
ncbi:MAG TPA: MFS transporter [Streptosporangiaceae bacterium]|jgi:MFS family permease